MMYWKKSQPSTDAADLSPDQGHALTMASLQHDLHGKLREMEKSLGKISEIEKTQKFELQTLILELLRLLSESSGCPLQPGSHMPAITLTMASAAEPTPRQSEVMKSLAELSAQQKSIMEELRLMRTIIASPSKSQRTTPNFTEIYETPSLEPFNPFPSFPMVPPTTINQGEDRSVYLFVSFYDGQYTDAIYQVTFKHGGGVSHEPPFVEVEDEFSNGFYVQGARIFNRSELYILLQGGYNNPPLGDSSKSFGYIINTEIGSYYSSLPPNLASKPLATLVSAYDKLYYVASPACLQPITEPSFERYDREQDIWERMPSFPFYRDDGRMEIIGYAVCYGVILFSLWDSDMNPDVVAFHESRNQWNRVTSASYAPFRGRAVVVGDTIYALHALMVEEIIAFSFRMDKGDHGGIAYSLTPLFILRGLEIACPPVPFCELNTGYLVHLGNHDFFHVKTGSPNSEAHPKVQYLCITTFQIVVEGGKHIIRTINSTVHPVDVKGRDWFFLEFCFTPECGDYEPIEEDIVTSINQPKEEETTLETTQDETFSMWEVTRSEVLARQCQRKRPRKKPSWSNRHVV
ncbi:hypothetical protein L3X38_029505 [Prunus dulcis]|uniref:Uncharacterized protein n=1 Tax=Prunus dulcis TaxID=3755 RepID=A0AAD4VS13_PRUDU|nr:hypothetical protein L3X38_029505 [Prunus dulcis]